MFHTFRRCLPGRGRAGLLAIILGHFLVSPGIAGLLSPPVQVGNLLEMTNNNVRLEYDLNTGRANFYWQNSLKIAGFYAGVGLENYVTGTAYTNRSWTVSNNTVVVTSTRGDLPTMRQI